MTEEVMKLQLKLENLEGVIEGIEKRLSRMEVEVRTISDVLRSYSAFKQKHKNIEFDWRKTPFQPFTWDDGINNTTKTEGDEE
jgi:hypothetical protein